ncbi:hypothetical protein [Streptomyces mayteni]
MIDGARAIGTLGRGAAGLPVSLFALDGVLAAEVWSRSRDEPAGWWRASGEVIGRATAN